MIDYRLLNVMLKTDDFMKDHEEVFYRCEGTAQYNTEAHQLEISGSADFLTYFNAISVEKWLRYTSVDNVWLHLELSGEEVEFVAQKVIKGQTEAASLEPSKTLSCEDGVKAFDLELPIDNAVLASFILKSEAPFSLMRAYYYTKIDEHLVRPINLALCTTTFNREDYIIPNINAIKAEILDSDEPISQAFHMFVVDNGRTLDAKALSDRGVSVLPNKNSGGSGGFARGMMEALAADTEFTHVLLMDDDVRVLPESFKRTFNLLSLANENYKDAFVSGAMLVLETPNVQYEDVSYVSQDGTYRKIKPDLHIDVLSELVANEQTSLEVENAYAAWWYCCIPVKAIKEHGLPLPLFVRCDDVEYGLRCKPVFMAMDGICVWHAGFIGRFRASVDCYQFTRNYLVMTAVEKDRSDTMFLMRTARTLRIYLRTMAYDKAELLLDGLEDFLKGPEFLMQAEGEAIMKQNGQKNEKLIPLDDIDRTITADLVVDPRALDEKKEAPVIIKLWRTLPYDRHLLPDFLLRNKPAAILYSNSAHFTPATVATKTLVALDLTGTTGHVRTLDKARYKIIKERWKRLQKEYRQNAGEVSKRYQEAMPYMTSAEYWRSYLGL